MKLWGGRFEAKTNELVDRFNSSFDIDKRLYHYDIMGSISHVKMLAKVGVISEDEKNKIVGGLEQIEEEIEKKDFADIEFCEDIHSYIETKLIEKIGPTGGKMHTARSRNDQIALDMRLYLRENTISLQKLLLSFLSSLLELAKKYSDVICPGYTHLQRAQPITFGHYLLAYYYKLKRDYERWNDNLKRINVLPLGSCALAGTSFPIDREWVAKDLHFASVCKNSLDGVSDRDYIIEFIGIASSIIMHLSRFSEEIILWSSNEFDFIELDDSFTTGSSIMPQKKNPDVAELIRGKTGRIYGYLIQLLTMMKGLPLAYNKDMQEDKEAVFNTVDNLNIILKVFPRMLETMRLNKDNMRKAAGEGYTNATELANYMVDKGMPFRKAHEVVGKIVLYALDKGLELTDLNLKEWKEMLDEYKIHFSEELIEKLKKENCVKRSNSTGGTSPAETERLITKECEWLSSQ